MGEIKLYNGDCVENMKKIKDGSVHLIITDPPYNLGNFMISRDTNLKKMRENFFASAGWDNLEYSEWVDSMDHFFAESARVMAKGGAMIIKTTGIWHKLNPMPRNMNLHFVNSTETWLYFIYKKKTGTFNNKGMVLHDFIETAVTPAGERKYGKHPTQKPEALMEHFISVLSNEGECVLDPFMGSGTTGVVAKRNNRNFIGIELDKHYFAMAEQRIQGVTI